MDKAAKTYHFAWDRQSLCHSDSKSLSNKFHTHIIGVSFEKEEVSNLPAGQRRLGANKPCFEHTNPGGQIAGATRPINQYIRDNFFTFVESLPNPGHMNPRGHKEHCAIPVMPLNRPGGQGKGSQ